METKLRNTIFFKVASILIGLSVTITVITIINLKTDTEKYKKDIDTAYSEMIRQKQIALKRGFRWGVKELGMKVTSEGFDESLENLENIPEEDIIEFRFKDGKIGHIKGWKTEGEK